MQGNVKLMKVAFCLIVLGILLGSAVKGSYEVGHNTALDWDESKLVSKWAGFQYGYVLQGDQVMFQYEESGKTVTKYATLLMCDGWEKPRLFGLSRKLECRSFVALRNRDGKIEILPNESVQRP
jgi:hypothetical protein